MAITGMLLVAMLLTLGAGVTLTPNSMLKKQENELIGAVQLGDLQKVRSLLINNIDVEIKIDDDKTLLMVAVKNNFEDIARLLIEKGANVNAQSVGTSTSVLTMACSPNRVTIRQEGGVRHFQHFSLPANPKLVKYLIEKDANVNPALGISPLMEAVAREELEVCTLLIENGADVNYTIKGDGGYSTLQKAKLLAIKRLLTFFLRLVPNTKSSK